MLLPSPIEYDVSRKLPKYPTRSLFPSFSLSPAASASGQSLTNVYSACYALQMILRSSETLNEENPWQSSPSSTESSFSPSKRRLRARSKSSDCYPDNHAKSRLKYAKSSLSFHSLVKRMNFSIKKENFSGHIESETKGGEGSDYNDAKTDKKAEVDPSTPKRHRIAHILFLKRSERSKSTYPGLQKSYKQGPPKLLVSSLGTDEKKINDRSTEEDRSFNKLLHQKLKIPKSEWHTCTRCLNHQQKDTENQWNGLSYQVKSVLKEIREET